MIPRNTIIAKVDSSSADEDDFERTLRGHCFEDEDNAPRGRIDPHAEILGSMQACHASRSHQGNPPAISDKFVKSHILSKNDTIYG
jgi:hypothetical protein